MDTPKENPPEPAQPMDENPPDGQAEQPADDSQEAGPGAYAGGQPWPGPHRTP